jgi:hypothetical protein
MQMTQRPKARSAARKRDWPRLFEKRANPQRLSFPFWLKAPQKPLEMGRSDTPQPRAASAQAWLEGKLIMSLIADSVKPDEILSNIAVAAT